MRWEKLSSWSKEPMGRDGRPLLRGATLLAIVGLAFAALVVFGAGAPASAEKPPSILAQTTPDPAVVYPRLDTRQEAFIALIVIIAGFTLLWITAVWMIVARQLCRNTSTTIATICTR